MQNTTHPRTFQRRLAAAPLQGRTQVLDVCYRVLLRQVSSDGNWPGTASAQLSALGLQTRSVEDPMFCAGHFFYDGAQNCSNFQVCVVS